MAEAHNAVHFVESTASAPLRQKLAASDEYLTIKIDKTFYIRVCACARVSRRALRECVRTPRFEDGAQ